ncbi:MAG: hypothetical protein VW828_00875 [Candidatus Puniceispirillum sp.]
MSKSIDSGDFAAGVTGRGWRLSPSGLLLDVTRVHVMRASRCWRAAR